MQNDLTTTEQAMVTQVDILRALSERGIKRSPAWLTGFLNKGDIRQQLGMGGNAGKRLFPADVVEILSSFLPWFDSEPGHTLDAAPLALRGFLTKQTGDDGRLTGSRMSERLPSDLARVVDALERIAERQQEQADEWLTGDEAAAMLKCSVSALRRCVRPVKRGRWSREMVYRYMAEMRRATE